MKQLVKYNLDFDPAWIYMKKKLDQVNILSSALIQWINFKEGHFFTLLPIDANLERLYEFKAGMVLVQNPTIEYMSKGRKASYSEIPTIRDELALFGMEKRTHKNLMVNKLGLFINHYF